MDESALREQVSRALQWGEAHVDWKRAVKGVPSKGPRQAAQGRATFALGAA